MYATPFQTKQDTLCRCLVLVASGLFSDGIQRQELKRHSHKATFFDFARDFRLADAIAQTILTMSISVLIYGSPRDEIGFAIYLDR